MNQRTAQALLEQRHTLTYSELRQIFDNGYDYLLQSADKGLLVDALIQMNTRMQAIQSYATAPRYVELRGCRTRLRRILSSATGIEQESEGDE